MVVCGRLFVDFDVFVVVVCCSWFVAICLGARRPYHAPWKKMYYGVCLREWNYISSGGCAILSVSVLLP